MKKFSVLMIALAAIFMVSCGGNEAKEAEAVWNEYGYEQMRDEKKPIDAIEDAFDTVVEFFEDAVDYVGDVVDDVVDEIKDLF